MKTFVKLGLMVALALLLVNQAHAGLMPGQSVPATASNNPPPAGPVVLDMATTNEGAGVGVIVHDWTQVTTQQWSATSASTNISFAFREDPAFIGLTNVVVTNQTTHTNVPVVNGDFSAGPVGSSTPTGWTYLNTFGATFGGVVENNTGLIPGPSPPSGFLYYDGAVQAYDSITQAIATTPGDLYTISFYIGDNSGLSNWQQLSTNGNTTGTGGNGVDMLVYAGAIPHLATPEPTSMALAGMGLVALVGYARRRRQAAAV